MTNPLTFEFEIRGEYDFQLLSLLGGYLKGLGHNINYYITNEKEDGIWHSKKFAESIKQQNIKDMTFERDFNVDACIALQPPRFKRKYKGRKIKISYASNFALQPSFAAHESTLWGLDGFIAQGPLTVMQAGKSFPRNRIKTMNGAMQYDAYIRGEIKFDKDEFSKKFHLDKMKKSILYLPTWDEHSSIDLFFEQLKVIGRKYNLILRPHDSIYNLADSSPDGWFVRENPEAKKTYRFNLKERIRKLADMSEINIQMRYSLPEAIENADMILIDAKSGVLLETLFCCHEKPIIGLTPLEDEEIRTRYLPEVHEMCPLLNDPNRLLDTIEKLFLNDTYLEGRKRVRSFVWGDNSGHAIENAANGIFEILKLPPYHQRYTIKRLKTAITWRFHKLLEKLLPNRKRDSK